MFAYAQAFSSRPGACNGAHNLGNRLVRWLLMMHDRIDGNTLLVTQDLLAEMLGAHRPSITLALRELEIAGLIERSRRQITILDREGLLFRRYDPSKSPTRFPEDLFLEELRLVLRTQGLGGPTNSNRIAASHQPRR
jgi:hypothetical protein